MTSSSNNPNPKKNYWKNLIIWASIAFLLRWQVLEPRWIPSGSMLPTLQIQDKILIEKVTPKIKRRFHDHLGRNSIVVFNPPNALIKAGYDEKSALIKRVVGIAGDKIEIHNGKLLRNGEGISEPWISEKINYEMAEINVPDNSLWVLGDNRNNSLDSHLWGPLPEENLIGTALLRYWPIKRLGSIRFPQPN